jgi:hypothetical protein
MVLPQQLIGEVEELRTEGFSVELIDAEGYANMLFREYPLPPGYNATSATLLLRFPPSYPNGRPDMFWTDPGLTRADGAIPPGADHFEEHMGRRWRRFSWHPQRWNPANDDLRTYLEFVNTGLARATA